MSLRQKICIILIYLWTLNFNAQDNSIKFFGIGLSCSASNGKIPDIAKTPYLFYKSSRHEIFAGVDIYTNTWHKKIFGLQAGYKFYLLNPEKKFNVFVDCNFQYVQYGQGAALPIPYNYLPTDDNNKDLNLYRTQSFINTFGLGINYDFFNRFSFHLVASGGYNYYQTTISPTNDNLYGYYNNYPMTKTIPVFFTKFGLTYKMYKSVPKQTPTRHKDHATG